MSDPLDERARMKVRIIRTGLDLFEATDLLDWLDGQGIRDRQLSYSAERGFTVSYAPYATPENPDEPQ